jgi:hypothetical protein
LPRIAVSMQRAVIERILTAIAASLNRRRG